MRVPLQVAYANGKCIKTKSKIISKSVPKSMKIQCRKSSTVESKREPITIKNIPKSIATFDTKKLHLGGSTPHLPKNTYSSKEPPGGDLRTENNLLKGNYSSIGKHALGAFGPEAG